MSNDDEMTEEFDADIEDQARVLTILIKTISPYINEGETYEYLYDALCYGLNDDDAIELGIQIRSTFDSGQSSVDN